MSIHEINTARRKARADLPRLVPGAKLWHLPIRWWEPDDYAPEPVTVLRGTLCAFADHDRGYLPHADLFHSEAAARAEMAARTAILDAENEAELTEIMRRVHNGENWLTVLLEVTE